MAGGARARIRTRFPGVPGAEPGAMEPRERRVVEGELRRKRGDRAHPMARGARALAVTTGAEIGFTRSANAVLAQPVPVVHHMRRGDRVLGGEFHVAPLAVTDGPLIAVLVAAEADRHFRLERLGLRVPRGGVAADAVSVHGGHVLPVIEAEVLARELGGASHVGGAVAVETGARIVRARVAVEAVGGGGEMERLVVAVTRDASVARQAVDPIGRVRAMLEGVRRIAALQAEDPRAGSESERQEKKERRELHGSSKERAMRASAFVSKR